MKTYSDDEVTLDAYPDSDVIIDKPEEKPKEIGLATRIGVETAGALAGEYAGAAAGSAVPIVGTVAGGYVGGALGAGAATYGMDIAEGKTKTEAAKSAALSAGAQLVMPAIIRKAAPPVGRFLSTVADEIPKSLGWISGLGRKSIERIQKDPSLVMDNLNITKYEVEDTAKALAKTIKDNVDGSSSPVMKELAESMDRVLTSDKPADVLSYILGKTEDEAVKGTLTGMTDNFVEKKIALDTQKILGDFGVKDAGTGVGALAAYGLLNLSALGTGLGALAIKSPVVAGAAAVAETVAKKSVEKAIEKTPEIAKKGLARGITSAIKNQSTE